MHTSTQSSMSLNSWIGGAQINYANEATTGMFDASDDLAIMPFKFCSRTYGTQTCHCM